MVPTVLALPLVNTMPLSIPILVPLLLLKKDAISLLPVKLTLLITTPSPTNF
jgi:hypothetical protein